MTQYEKMMSFAHFKAKEMNLKEFTIYPTAWQSSSIRLYDKKNKKSYLINDNLEFHTLLS